MADNFDNNAIPGNIQDQPDIAAAAQVAPLMIPPPSFDFRSPRSDIFNVCIVIDGVRLYAIKEMLAYHSPVFERMLISGSFSETEAREIKLSGIAVRDFEELLNCLIGGKNVNVNNLEFVLPPAHYYQVALLLSQSLQVFARLRDRQAYDFWRVCFDLRWEQGLKVLFPEILRMIPRPDVLDGGGHMNQWPNKLLIHYQQKKREGLLFVSQLGDSFSHVINVSAFYGQNMSTSDCCEVAREYPYPPMLPSMQPVLNSAMICSICGRLVGKKFSSSSNRLLVEKLSPECKGICLADVYDWCICVQNELQFSDFPVGLFRSSPISTDDP